MSNCDAFEVLRKAAPGTFDVLLLDPTCSSSGTSHIDRKMSGAPEPDLEQLSLFQKRLLTCALKEGARIGAKFVSYSTCSVYDEENE